jgi:hypothetical protein
MRNPTPDAPVHQHTSEYWARLNELRRSHPHLAVQELQHFLNHPASDEAPAKPAPPKPAPSMAERIWPHLAQEK